MTLLPVIPDNIPAELKVGERHVGWKLETRDGKLTKPPYKVRAPGGFAKVDDPSTWCDFEEAFMAHQMGLMSGVGYVLTTGDDLVGFDLDKVRDPLTGAIDAKSAALVRWLDSYTEVSPSGTGLRILVRGTLPDGTRRRGRLEVYSEGRYLTLTGHVLDGVRRTIERPDLAAIHAALFPPSQPVDTPSQTRATSRPSVDDATLIERARRAKNGAKFIALFDHGQYGDDHSAADLGLLNMLLYWCDGDRGRAESLFRQSALFRPKWDARHYADGRTYGDGTVQFAAGARSV